MEALYMCLCISFSVLCACHSPHPPFPPSSLPPFFPPHSRPSLQALDDAALAIPGWRARDLGDKSRPRPTNNARKVFNFGRDEDRARKQGERLEGGWLCHSGFGRPTVRRRRDGSPCSARSARRCLQLHPPPIRLWSESDAVLPPHNGGNNDDDINGTDNDRSGWGGSGVVNFFLFLLLILLLLFHSYLLFILSFGARGCHASSRARGLVYQKENCTGGEDQRTRKRKTQGQRKRSRKWKWAGRAARV